MVDERTERLEAIARELEGLFNDDGFHIDGNPDYDGELGRLPFNHPKHLKATEDALKAAHDRVEAMNEEEIVKALRTARRALLLTLIVQEYHEHMLDDCGDDLEAVTYSWHVLHQAYFLNDGECVPDGRKAMHEILETYHEAPARDA